MLFDYIRILSNISAIRKDLSYENQDDSATTSLSQATTDYLLIGMQYPFNNFYLYMDELNGPRDSVETIAILTPYNAVGPVYEVQKISFSRVPTQGVWTLAMDALTTAELPFNVTAAELQAAIREWVGFETITVTGNFTDGFTITLQDIGDPDLFEVGDSTLKRIEPSVMQLSYWDGSKWVDAVDVLDGTSQLGASLSRSGHVIFNQDRQKTGWGKVNDPVTQGPQELSGTPIYDLYWLRLRFTGPIPEDVTLKELGFAWTTDQKMRGLKSEVDRYLPSFKTGKTDWIPEIMSACKMMITDMKKANLVYGPQQMVRLDDFWLPCTYKALWVVYSSLGPAYIETANAMAHQYHKTLNVDNVTIDLDNNGRVSDWEKDAKVKVGVR